MENDIIGFLDDKLLVKIEPILEEFGLKKN